MGADESDGEEGEDFKCQEDMAVSFEEAAMARFNTCS